MPVSHSRVENDKNVQLFDMMFQRWVVPIRLVYLQADWLRRDGNHAVLRCNTTGDTWQITCSGSEWRGQTRVNCSQSASSSSAAAFPLDGMAGWNMSQFFAHEAFPLSKVFGLPF